MRRVRRQTGRSILMRFGERAVVCRSVCRSSAFGNGSWTLIFTVCVDYEYYLSQQILPPIERLCEPIEGTDRARLAECLGLDPNRYRTATAAESESRAFSTLDSLISDAERYKDCDHFVVRCRSCKGQVEFAFIGDRAVSDRGFVVSSVLSKTHRPLATVLDTLIVRSYLSRVPVSDVPSEPPGTARVPDPRAHIEVLRGLDGVQ